MAPNGNLRVLLIDDEKDDLFFIRRNLLRCGRFGHIDEAESGAQALERLATSDYDIALLDLRMPEMSGFELLDALPTPTPCPFAVWVATAAHYQDIERAQQYECVVTCLIKPLNEADASALADALIGDGEYPYLTA